MHKMFVSGYSVVSTDDNIQLSAIREQFPLFYTHPSVAGIAFWGYVEGRSALEVEGLIYENEPPRPAMTWLMDYLGR